MSTVFMYALCVVTVFASFVSSQVNPLSPCPRVFSYVNDGQTWYGIITVGPPFESDLRLNVKMDIPYSLPSSYLGRIEMLGERSDVVVSLMNGRNIRYRVDFPTLDYIPVITSILFNGNEICSGPSIQIRPFTSVELKHLLNTNLNNVYGGYRGPPPQPQPRPVYENLPSPTYRPENSDGNPFPSNPFLTGNMNEITSRPINPINPWLNNMFTKESEKSPTRSTTNNIPTISQSNPWLQNVYYQETQTSTSRPSTPAVRPTRPTPRPTPRQTPRPQPMNIPADKFERPNPDTFALNNRRTTTSEPPNVASGNDHEETRKKCGISKKLNNALVVRGVQTEKGDWPWLAAIFVKRVSSLNFQCGGTLISKEVVISAAHCLGQNSNRQVRKEEVIIRLGVHNMQDWVDTDAKSFPVNELILPPAFEGGLVLKNDIVLMKINRVRYTDYILPACLWSESLDVNPFYGKFGTVVGWGRNEEGLIASPEPRLTTQKIVTTDECRDSNPAFNTLTSSTTLCAGNRNGSGPCNGDSGGGMYIYINGRWTLRGVLSNSLSDPNSPNVCNLADYLVYTDIAKFVEWINYYL